MDFSYLHTKVSKDKFLANPRDVSGGRSRAVIIKDLTNASNCAVVPTQRATRRRQRLRHGGQRQRSGCSGAGRRSRAPTRPARSASARALTAQRGDRRRRRSAASTVLGSGVAVNITRQPAAARRRPTRRRPASSTRSTSASSGCTLVPRADINYTGDSWGTSSTEPDRRDPAAMRWSTPRSSSTARRPLVRPRLRPEPDRTTTRSPVCTSPTSRRVCSPTSSPLEPRRYGVAAGFKF